MCQNSKNDFLQLFVYGTLRKRGVANYYLQDFELVSENIWLPGFKMFDAGWYPFVVNGPETSRIIGDIYKVPQGKINKIDIYEGPEYKRVFVDVLESQIYIKADGTTRPYLQVQSGDWLEYQKTKSS